MRGARDSPAGAGWITIASVVLEPRVESGLRDVRVAIVGAGFGGIGTAIRLREAGYEDLVILERDDGLGGVWWANTYPGCACDVAAHLYSFSFAATSTTSGSYAWSPATKRSRKAATGRRCTGSTRACRRCACSGTRDRCSTSRATKASRGCSSMRPTRPP